MCDPASLMLGSAGGGMIKTAIDKKKERKEEKKFNNYAQSLRTPEKKFTATNNKTEMKTGVNIGGQY